MMKPIHTSTILPNAIRLENILYFLNEAKESVDIPVIASINLCLKSGLAFFCQKN